MPPMPFSLNATEIHFCIEIHSNYLAGFIQFDGKYIHEKDFSGLFLSGWINFFGILLFSSGGIRKGFLRAHVGNFQLTPGGGQGTICVKKNGFYAGCRSTPNFLYFFFNLSLLDVLILQYFTNVSIQSS